MCSINVVDGLPGAIDIRYLEARYVSLVAVGTSVDGIRPGEGVVGDAAGQSNDLAINRRGGQRDIAAGLDAGEADGGELIKAIRTVNMSREQPGQTLQTTALVHEVYLKLVNVKDVDWQNRAHFYGLCARLMRRILVDFARSRNYQKRGGKFPHIELEEAATVSAVVGSELLAVDEALKQLAAMDTRKSEVVELRFFGGLTVEETATALQVSPETVMVIAVRWRFCRSAP